MSSAEADDEPWTIRRVLTFATGDFTKRGHESPRLEAELLLSFALGVDRVRLLIEAVRPLTAPELATYRGLIQRRRAGEPIAYLLGMREFFGLELRSDARALVPRPDTEALVEEALERTAQAPLAGDALDLCTGTGCVALAFARRRPTWRVTAVDLSTDAAALARHNAVRVGAWNALRVLEGDLFTPLQPSERFDLITANAPYIPTAELATLPREVRDWEPRLALDGGQDGLDLVRRLVDEARRWLRPGGTLALELAWDQSARVRELLASHGYIAIGTRRDYGGRERVVAGNRAQ